MRIYMNAMNDNAWPAEMKTLAGINIDLSVFDCLDFPTEHFSKDVAVSEISAVNNKENGDIRGEKKKRRKRKPLTGLSRKRREANARERRRVEELNRGFVHLKRALPLPNVDISKFEILRLAIKWIDHLETMLENHNSDQRELLTIRQMETSKPEDLENLTLEGDTPTKRPCLYYEFPDLQNTLWEESIGLQGKIVAIT